MNEVAYHRAQTVADAVASLRQNGSMAVAGGTNLIDLMKTGVAEPARLVDVSRLPLNRITALPDGGLRIGAMVRNSDAAHDPQVR